MLDIAIIFNDFNQPAQPYVTMCFKALKKAGAPVFFFSNAPVSRNSDNVTILPILQGKSPVIKYFIKHIINAPIGFIKWVRQNRYLTVTDLIKGWARFAPLIVCNPKVIHLANSYLYHKYAPCITKLECISIATFRGYEFKELESGTNDQVGILKLLEECNYLHFVSKYLRQEAIEFGARPEKTAVIYPGIDVDFYYPRTNRKEKEDNLITLTTVGRLVPEKGYQVSLNAIKGLVENGYQIRYWIAGWGPAEDALRTMVHELNIQNHVKFMGYQSPEQVRDLLDQSDIYLQPSFFESLCVAAIEASAMGLPVIASRVGGLPEVVEDDISGILVPPDDSTAIAEAISSLAQNSKRRLQMGRNARRRAVEIFSLQREVEEWLTFYSKLIYS
jgi:glycosyltransferase involved in cell wall biosynthesis